MPGCIRMRSWLTRNFLFGKFLRAFIDLWYMMRISRIIWCPWIKIRVASQCIGKFAWQSLIETIECKPMGRKALLPRSLPIYFGSDLISGYIFPLRSYASFGVIVPVILVLQSCIFYINQKYTDILDMTIVSLSLTLLFSPHRRLLCKIVDTLLWQIRNLSWYRVVALTEQGKVKSEVG